MATEKIKVLIDTSPLNNEHAIRGVGNYTRFLTEYLEKEENLEIRRSSGNDADFRPDIVHYPFFDLFFPTLPLIKKKKTVLTIHDVIPLIFPRQYPVGKRGRLAFIKQRLALKNVDAIITDSESSKTDVMKYLHVPIDKIQVVPLAANPQLEVADARTQRSVARKLKLPKHYLLYVGDINYNKNLPQLIKMLKFLDKDIKLVCVGKNFTPQNIPEWQWIESQIALSNVADRIKFYNNILASDIETMSALYSAARAYIQPSIYEGFGLPILEAMRCQTPVICAENSSLLEVANQHALIVPEATAKEFAGAVKKVLSWKKGERNKYLKKAATWEKNFTWQKTAKETAAIYKTVLSL